MKALSLKTLFCLMLATANWSWGLPLLQLDIVNGIYDTTEQSTVATADAFTLRALLKPNTTTIPNYFISVAISPGQALVHPTPNFGTFVFAGTTFDSSDLVYGTPPTDPAITNELSPHGIFPTYYLEFAFNFGANTIAAYNVQTDASASGNLYYKDFAVDTTGLLAGYQLHFDLYDDAPALTGRHFAPYSHDASSRIKSGGYSVSENHATLILFGIGLIGLAVSSRVRNKFSKATKSTASLS